MFALLSARLRRWLLLAVGVPVAAWLLDRIGLALQQRNASSRTGRALQRTGGWLRGRRGRRRRRATRVGW